MAESTHACSPIDPASLLERVVYRRDRITCAKRTLVKIASSRSGAHRLRIDRTRTRFHEDPARACPVARIIGSGFASFWLVGWRPPTASSWVEGRHCRDRWVPLAITSNPASAPRADQLLTPIEHSGAGSMSPGYRGGVPVDREPRQASSPTSDIYRYLCSVIWTSGSTSIGQHILELDSNYNRGWRHSAETSYE